MEDLQIEEGVDQQGVNIIEHESDPEPGDLPAARDEKEEALSRMYQ